jgi:hypothetical protein
MQGFLLMEENQAVLLRNTITIREIYQLNLKLVYSELRETTDYDGNDVPEIVTQDMRFSLPVTNRQIMALLSSEPDSYRDAVRVDLILDISGEIEEGNASKVAT